MSAIDDMRKAFDDCTVMAGVENDFECVYIVKSVALAMLDEIEDDNARLNSCLSDDADNAREIMAENDKLQKLLKEAFDGGALYGAESVRYGVDAVAYNWKHWIKKHDVTSYVAGHKDESTEAQEQRSGIQISFNPFDMGTSEDKARKVCEEAMEFYGEHHECEIYGLEGDETIGLFSEIGDVLTATLNYCAAKHIDPQRCIDMAERKNRNRGRYEAC